MPTSEWLAQQQLDAYNARDIEVFISLYAEHVEAFDINGKLLFSGREAMRQKYERLFSKNPRLHCKLINRMVMGDWVIDYEHVKGKAEGQLDKAIAIYHCVGGKIQTVRFISGGKSKAQVVCKTNTT